MIKLHQIGSGRKDRMDIGFDLINGISVGIEFVPAAEEYDNTIILDVFIIRLLFQWA